MATNDNNRRRKFYDQMSETYDLGTFEEFDQKMNNAESRKKLHDFIDKDGKYDIGTFEYFDEAMRPIEQKATPVEQQPVAQTTAQPQQAAQEPTSQPQQQPVTQQPADSVAIDGNVVTESQLQAMENGAPVVQKEPAKYGTQEYANEVIEDDVNPDNPYKGMTRQQAINEIGRKFYNEWYGQPGSYGKIEEELAAYNIARPEEYGHIVAAVRNHYTQQVARNRIEQLLSGFKHVNNLTFDDVQAVLDSHEAQKAIEEDLQHLGLRNTENMYEDEESKKKAREEYEKEKEAYYQMMEQQLVQVLTDKYGYLPASDSRSSVGRFAGSLMSGGSKAHDDRILTREYEGMIADQYENTIKDIFDEAYEKASEKSASIMKDADATKASSLGYALMAEYESNKLKDPDTILKAILEKVSSPGLLLVENQAMLDRAMEDAAARNMDINEYLEKYIAPAIQRSIMREFRKEAVKREMPKSQFEYIMRGLSDDSVIGMILNGILMTPSQLQYRDLANAQYGENNSNAWIEGAKLATGMASDFWLWGGWGKLGAMATGRLLAMRVGALAAANGITRQAALQMLEAEGKHYLGKRVVEGMLRHIPQSMITMSGAQATSEAVRGITRGENLDDVLLNVFNTAATSGVTGAAFGFTGGVMGGLTSKLAGWKRLLGKMAGLEVEAGTLYSTEELQKMMAGEDAFENPYEGMLEANISLGFIKASGNPFESARKLWNAIQHPVKTAKGMTKPDLGVLDEKDVKHILESTGGKDLLDALTSMRPQLTEEQGEREGYLTEEKVLKAADAYKRFMSDPDVPWDTKQKVARMHGAIVPPAGYEVDAQVELANADGKDWIVRTRDMDGQCIRELHYNSSKEAYEAEEEILKKAGVNRAYALQERIDAYDAQKYYGTYLSNEYSNIAEKMKEQGLDADDLTIEERQCVYLYQHMNELETARQKVLQGQELTPEEKQLVDIYQKRFIGYVLEGHGHEAFDRKFEREHGLEEGTLNTADFSKNTALLIDYNRAMEEYIREMNKIEYPEGQKLLEGATSDGAGPETGGGEVPPATEEATESPEQPEAGGTVRSESRQAAYDRGVAAANNYADIPNVAYEGSLAAQRLLLLFPDTDPVMGRLRRDVMTAIENGDEAEVDRLIQSNAGYMTDQQKQALEQYRDAMETNRGVDDGLVQDVSNFEQKTREQLKALTASDGTIRRIELSDGRTVYLLSGDPFNKYGAVMVTDGENNEQVSVANIKAIGPVEVAEDIIRRKTEEYSQHVEAQMKAIANGSTFLPGSQVDLSIGGNIFRAQTNLRDQNGNYIFVLEDGSQVPMTPSDAQMAVAEATRMKIQQQLAAEKKAVAVQQQTDRFNKGIVGFADGNPDLTAKATDPKAAAEYLMKDSEDGDHAPVLKSIESDIDNLNAIKARNLEIVRTLTNKEAIEGLTEEEKTALAEANQIIDDVEARRRKFGEIRQELMDDSERNKLESERLKEINKALDTTKKNNQIINISIGEEVPTAQDLMERFEEKGDAADHIDKMMADTKAYYRDKLFPYLSKVRETLDDFRRGLVDLNEGELADLTRQLFDLESEESYLINKQNELKNIASSIGRLYTQRENANLTTHERKMRQLEKETNREKKLKLAKEAYSDDPEAASVLDDVEPQDVYEWIAANLGEASLNWEGIQRGEHYVRGVSDMVGKDKKRGIGNDSDTKGYNYFLAPTGKGKGYDEVVHAIAEGSPYSTEEVSDALYNMLTGASKPTDISHRIVDDRIARAEEIYETNLEREREAEEEAKHDQAEGAFGEGKITNDVNETGNDAENDVILQQEPSEEEKVTAKANADALRSMLPAITEKYSSYPVEVVDFLNDDIRQLFKELFDKEPTDEELHSFIDEGLSMKAKAVFIGKTGKIYVFAHNTSPDILEEFVFHENIHPLLEELDEASRNSLFETYWNNSTTPESEADKELIKSDYPEEEWYEEFFVHHLAHKMKNGTTGKFFERLTDEQQAITDNILKEIRYDRESETKARRETKAEPLGEPEENGEGSYSEGSGDDRGVILGYDRAKEAEQRAAEREAQGMEESGLQAAGSGTGGVKSNIQGLEDYSEAEIKKYVREFVQEQIEAVDADAEIVDIAIIGSRTNGTAKPDSDLDVLVEYKGKEREDDLFNLFTYAEPLTINGINVDINPITKGKSGTIAEFLERNKDYQKEPSNQTVSTEETKSFPARLAKAKEETDTNPTEEQKKAGNYKMGHISFGGYQMSIENPKGSIRSGKDASGRPWSIEMKDTYGYIREKYDADGDHIDFFINDDENLDDYKGFVFVVDQKNDQGEFDEHKVMYGYGSWMNAKRAYERNYEPGWWDKHVMSMTGTTKDDFDKWIADSDRKHKPFADYRRIQIANTISDPTDQLLADVEARKKMAEKPTAETTEVVAEAEQKPEVKPSYKDGELESRSLDDLKQLKTKRQKDLSTSRYLLGATNVKAGSDKEQLLNNNIAQAEADLDAIDAEIKRKQAERKARIEQQEIGGAMVDRLDDMGLDVTTDFREMRKARKAAEKDNSEEGKLRHFETPDGQIYGFVYRGKMYLDPRKIDANLPIHEYAHPWCEAFRKLNPEGWKNIVDLMKADKETWDFVKKLNPDLKDENDIAEEMIAKCSGEKGRKYAEEEYKRMNAKDPDYKSKWGNIWQNISKAIQDFWKKVGDFLHIKYESAEQVYDQVVRDFANKMNPRKRVEDWLKDRDKAYMEAVKQGDDAKAKTIFDEALRENIGNGITPFVSTGGYRGRLQKLAHDVKSRDPKAIAKVADLMAPIIPQDAVLVPAPSHTGKATDMLDLAQAISERTGAPVADVLTSEERPSQYDAKYAGKPIAAKDMGITLSGELPEGKLPVVIDNVVDTGNTAEACIQALGKGIVASLADSKGRYKRVATLKSAEPVVTDKKGQTIPLSKRFELPQFMIGDELDLFSDADFEEPEGNDLNGSSYNVGDKFEIVDDNNDRFTVEVIGINNQGEIIIDAENYGVLPPVEKEVIDDYRRRANNNTLINLYGLNESTDLGKQLTELKKQAGPSGLVGYVADDAYVFVGESGKPVEQLGVKGIVKGEQDGMTTVSVPEALFDEIMPKLVKDGYRMALIDNTKIRPLKPKDAVDKMLNEVERRKQVAKAKAEAKADEAEANKIIENYLKEEPKDKEEVKIQKRATKAVLKVMRDAKVPYKLATDGEERDMYKLFSMANQEAIKAFARRPDIRNMQPHGSMGRYIIYNMENPFGVPMYAEKLSVAKHVLDFMRRGKGEWQILDIGYPGEAVETRDELSQAAEIQAMMGWHGSGAKFDAFDHSHMGEGEGNQSYGWGTYITTVEGIGKMYAEQIGNKTKDIVFHNGREIDATYIGFPGFDVEKKVAKSLARSGGHKGSAIGSILNEIRIVEESIAREPDDKDFVQKGEKHIDFWKKCIESLENDEWSYEYRGPQHLLYKVDIPDDNGSNYFDWTGYLEEKQADNILSELKKRLLSDEEYGWNGEENEKRLDRQLEAMKKMFGATFYGRMSVLLGNSVAGAEIKGKRLASQLLSDLGYVGVKYPAEFMTGGREDGALNYVIFDEDDAKITDTIQFMVETPEANQEKNGILGWSDSNGVTLTKKGLNPNTPVHECSHLWDNWCQKEQPELWKQIVAAMKTTPMWQQIRKNPNYRAIWNDDDKMASEVKSRLTGATSEEEFTKAAFKPGATQDIINKVKSALKKFWESLLRLFGKTTKTISDEASSVEAIRRMTLRDLMNQDFEKVMKAVTEDYETAAMKGEIIRKTLMGVHNLSEEKLRKVIKAGGLANPSLAVVDTDQGVHTAYGDISLIPRASLIDMYTGRNAGTYAGDAWTPTYPHVERSLTAKGEKRAAEIANEVAGDDKELASRLRSRIFDYFEDNGDRLHFLFLKQKGLNPQVRQQRIEHSQEEYDAITKIFGEEMSGAPSGGHPMTKEQSDALVDLMVSLKAKKYETGLNSSDEKVRKLTQERLDEYRNSLLDENGRIWFAFADTFISDNWRDNNRRKAPQIDWYGTDNDASYQVAKEGLSEEYEKWKEALMADDEVQERLFAGYTPDGTRRYLPNTVKNASRLMNNNTDQNAYDQHGFGPTRAMLLQKFASLADIRRHKDLIKKSDEVEERASELSDELFDIIKQISAMQKLDSNPFINNDYAEARLQEAMGTKNPIRHLNKEYGYDIPEDGELASQLMNFMDDVKNLPAKYFETKFKRPVMLDEFEIAVVPEDTSADIVEALKNAGLDVRTYNNTGNEEQRKESRRIAVMDAVGMRDDILFHIETDDDEIERLEREPKEIGYRNVAMNEDGTLGSPMANRLGKKGEGRKATSTFEFGKWERSDENPELANEKGKIDLIKPNGKSVEGVDYNPYIHIRPNKVNKQFKEAWRRPELIYVETEYPASELNGEYRAEKAAKPVGKHKWGTQGESLILSRWDKPVRMVPWEEVADDWEKEFKGRGVEFDIVPPKLLPILAERGVEILPPHKGAGKECQAAYEAFRDGDNADKMHTEVVAVEKALGGEITPEEVKEALNSKLVAQWQKAMNGAKAPMLFGSIPAIIREMAKATIGWDNKYEMYGMFNNAIEAVNDYLQLAKENGLEADIADKYDFHDGDVVQGLINSDKPMFTKAELAAIEKCLKPKGYEDFLQAVQAVADEKLLQAEEERIKKYDDGDAVTKALALYHIAHRRMEEQYGQDERFFTPRTYINGHTDLKYKPDYKPKEGEKVETKYTMKKKVSDELLKRIATTPISENLLSLPGEYDIMRSRGDRLAAHDTTGFVDAAEAVGESLGGVEVKSVTYEQADRKTKVEIANGTKGIYNPNTGEVTLLLDNIEDVEDAKRTVYHEKLGHEGLVALLGSQEAVNKFGNFIFKSASKELKMRMLNKADEEGYRLDDTDRYSKAAQEVFGDIAADGPRTADEFSLITKVKHYLIKLLKAMGIKIKGLLNDQDLKYYVLKTGEALKRWNKMTPEQQASVKQQADKYDIMRSRGGKPRKRNDESLAQYMQRLREWEKWKIAEEKAAAANDPMPDKEAIDKKWSEKFDADLKEWRDSHGISEDDGNGPGSFPKREDGESPQEYGIRVADYEAKADMWKDAPSYFDYIEKAQKEYKQEYTDWKMRYDLQEAENVDMNVYEGNGGYGPVSDEDIEAETRMERDIAEAVGIEIDSEGAKRHAKLAVIERRKNLESSNAEDAIWLHDLINIINNFAEKQLIEEGEIKPLSVDRKDDTMIGAINEDAHVIRKKKIAERAKLIREALPFIIEGTYWEEVVRDESGNPIGVNDLRDQLPIKEGSELDALLSHIKDWYDEFYQILEEAGLRNDAGYIEDGYVNHVWDREKSDPKAWEKYVENYQRTKSPNMRHREIDTYQEGIDVGLAPKYTDIADMIAHYSRQNNEAVANKRFLQDLSGYVVEELNADGEIVSVLPLLNSEKPDALTRDRYTEYYVPGVGDVYVLNDVKKRFASIFGTMRTQDVADWLRDVAKAYDLAGSTMKKIQLSLSGFHMGALTEVAMAQMRPDRAMRALFSYIIVDSIKNGTIPAYAHPEDFKFAASHLVQLGATQDYAASDVNNITGKLREMMHNLYESDSAIKKAAGATGSVPAIMLDWVNKGMDKVLWNYLHDGLKIACFKMFAEQIQNRVMKEGLSEEMREKLLDEAGQYVNDTFGGQYFELLNITPATMKWMRRALLSPDWLISTQRHFFANFGFGSLYSDSSFKNYLKYNADNIKRALGVNVPHDELRRFRSRNAKLCYVLGVCFFFYTMMNALNAFFRYQDEQDQKDKAEEERKTNPEYRSPYELAYPDGMKWYDYTMLGNGIGQQTHLYAGRYEDGSETYVRWGKQFREFPEMFIGRHGVEFPTPLIERIQGKANPMVSLVRDNLGALGVWGFTNNSDIKEIQAKYGKTIGVLAMNARHLLPFSVPTQAEKEFKAIDLVMPSQKGFTRYKTVDYFKTYIQAGDMDGIVKTYNAAVMNNIDAEACLKAAISTVKATQRKELADGVSDLTTAAERFDKAEGLSERNTMRRKMRQYLAGNEYKAFSRNDAIEAVNSFLDGEDMEKLTIANQNYLMLQTSADVIADWRVDSLNKKANEYDAKIKEAKESGNTERAEALSIKYASWLKIKKWTNQYKYQLSRNYKKKLGESAEKDQETMNMIREKRDSLMSRINNLEPPK